MSSNDNDQMGASMRTAYIVGDFGTARVVCLDAGTAKTLSEAFGEKMTEAPLFRDMSEDTTSVRVNRASTGFETVTDDDD